MASIPNVFDGLGAALDEASWLWLMENLPEVASATEGAVRLGATPEATRRFVVSRTGRYELALRVEQACRYLERKT